MIPLVLYIPLSDFFPGRKPDVIECFCITDKVPDSADPVRLSNHMGVKRDIHEAACSGALLIEPVELFFEHFKTALRPQSLPQKAEIIYLRRVGYRDHGLTASGLHHVALIIV